MPSIQNQVPDNYEILSPEKYLMFPADQPTDSGFGSAEFLPDLPNLELPSTTEKMSEFPEFSNKNLHDLTETFSQMSFDREDNRTRSVDDGVDIETGRSRTGCLPQETAVEMFTCFDSDGDSTFHVCVIKNMKKLVRVLIQHCPDMDCLNLTNNQRQTPLHLAVITRQPDITRRLICAGACVQARDMAGNTPLHIACARGYHDVVEQFLKPVSYEETFENNYEIPFQRLPQDLSARNYEGLTCLHLAALSRNLLVVKLLINAGADVNSREAKSGRTVLHLAVELDFTDLLLFLLCTRDVDVNSKTYAGQTPIQLACGRPHVETVHLLHDHGGSLVQTHNVSDADIDLMDIAMD